MKSAHTNTKHGHCKNGKRTPEYKIWEDMKKRCQNPNTKYYEYYGGRGITVCERWQKFENFLADVGLRPGPGYSIDRIENDGNYEPGNWRWATPKEQANNRRVAKPKSCGPQKQRWFYGHGPNGEMIIENNQHEVAREYKLNRPSISVCLRGEQTHHHGWKFQWIN